MFFITMWYLLSANTTFAFTHADSLRGSNGRGRAWWDVQKYSLNVTFDTATQSISGVSTIQFDIIGTPTDSMQIDLQEPMVIDSAYLLIGDFEGRGGIMLNYIVHAVRADVRKEGNVWWVVYDFKSLRYGKQKKNAAGRCIDSAGNEVDSFMQPQVQLAYHGTPRKAVNPPWDGGFSWKTDSAGNPWIAVSCQGLGASVWWPCKDAQWDEPDKGMDIFLDVPTGLSAISNGRLKKVSDREKGSTNWWWEVENPINSYDVTFYIGDYVHWHDTLEGEGGQSADGMPIDTLSLDYWVLRNNEAKARKQFAEVKPMLHCFEYWMGPYPFYEDGYKLVEAPYLGMEHQSAVAYGNKYKMGYMGFDRTGTGVGMAFDYIIVHESGHEWFGNNVTAKDMADNWIHEGITTFSEALFVECQQGRDKARTYCRGEWHNIENDKPIIGPYGVNEEGSNDMYDKGAAIMFMIRQLTNDDEKFRQMLRGLGKEFYHQTVTTAQVEKYIADHTGQDLKLFFDQYLRQKDEPKLEYTFKKKRLSYRFTNTIDGFTIPITISAGGKTATLYPTNQWQDMKWKKDHFLTLSKDFLYKVKSGH